MALESRVIQVVEEGATSKIPALVSFSDRTGNEMLILDELFNRAPNGVKNERF
jgi:hypothetical protein